MVIVKRGHGIVYGKYQFSCQQAKQFIRWLVDRGGEIACLVLEHYQPGGCEFNAWWEDMERLSEFEELQNKFIEECF